jgi:hypothetical protein
MSALFTMPYEFDPTNLERLVEVLRDRPSLDVLIEGPPQGKGRPRFDGRSGRAYSPAKTERWEKRAAADMLVAWGRQEPPAPPGSAEARPGAPHPVHGEA